MPWQLIYTSAPRGLLSGQSGFCTVARSADLREALAPRLEQLSSYHYLRVAEAATANRNPAISAFRLLDLRGAKYYVLTRIQPCGLDFTARTNHLAHHLIFQPDELARLPSPAALLRYWPGWMKSWQGEPRLIEDAMLEGLAEAGKSCLPAQTWARLTGDGGRAAGLLESECVRGCYLVCPPGSEEQVLRMYCETLQLLNFNGQFPLRPWRHTFTTFLQAEDNPNDFQWRACQEGTPAYKQALTRSAPLIALGSVRVPGNSLVKLAREEPKPPPASGGTPTSSSPPPKSTLKTVASEPSARGIFNPPPVIPVGPLKKPGMGRSDFSNFNISISSATLAGLGIFAAVLLGLWVLKEHSTKPPAGQGSPVTVSESKLAPVAAPPAEAPAPAPDVSRAKALESLAGEGPTYILAVPNLTNFSLPIDGISRFQNLLNSYARQDPGALPNDIKLEVNTDHWEFQEGSLMRVEGWKPWQFAASLGGSECVFDYGDWHDGKSKSMRVRANFAGVAHAFAVNFGFYAGANRDPFRLLIVNESNPPAPIRMSGSFVQTGRQDVTASLADPVRNCLNNLILLAGAKWQLRPYLQSRVGPARYLYKDWPAGDVPVSGCELDFAHIAARLRAESEDLVRKRDDLSKPLEQPIGAFLTNSTNSDLKSFQVFSPDTLTTSRFLDYLVKIKDAAPKGSLIKKWTGRIDSDQPDDVSGKLQDLYDKWIEDRRGDQQMLTSAYGGGTTNYFYAVWQLLKERERTEDQLVQAQKRLDQLRQVAYIGLCIVDPVQPKPPLVMIRFEGP